MTSIATALILVLHTVVPKISQDRLRVVTEDMVAVVDDEMTNGNLKSEIKRDEALAMLAAAVTHESGYREEVESCRLTGDGGRSIGLGQVMRGQNWQGHSRKQICSDRKLQLKLALHVIDKCWTRTPRASASFRCYTSGDAAKDSHTAKKEFKTYLKIKGALDAHKKDEEKKSKENPSEEAPKLASN
jgi:hypothetical protein